MSSQAGPSSTARHKSKQKVAPAPEPSRPFLSKETVDSDLDTEDHDDMDGSESESEDNDSPESEGDLEGVRPRHKADGATAVTQPSASKGRSLPRYVPPIGMSPITVSTGFKSSPFEYDAIALKPGVELWAIRVPVDLKPSRLSRLSITLPSPIEPHSHPSGSLNTNSQRYNLVPAGSSKRMHAHEVADEEGRQPTAGPGLVDAMAMEVDADEEELRVEGGEEMVGGMRLLVPRLSASGKLFVAPIPIKHHLLLTPQTPQSVPHPPSDDPHPLPSFLSTSIPASTTGTSTQMQSIRPGKRAQPTHLLKFRNMAYGFDTPGPKALKQNVVRALDSSVKEKKRRNAEGKVEVTPKKKVKT